MARIAACLDKTKFNRALHIIRGALEFKSAGKPTSYSQLLDIYVLNQTMRERLQAYIEKTETEAQALGMKAQDFKQSEILCAVFYWVCAAAGVRGHSCVS